MVVTANGTTHIRVYIDTLPPSWVHFLSISGTQNVKKVVSGFSKLVCLDFWMLIDLRTMNFLYPKYYDWLSIFHSFILFTCVKMWQISWFCTIVKMFHFFVVVIALNKLWFQDFIIQLDILQWQPIIILHEITLIKN